jgi:hypothetical protein
MDSDVLYAILMSCGWFFLLGWLALLLIACALAFRSDGDSSRRKPQVVVVAGRALPWEIQMHG